MELAGINHYQKLVAPLNANLIHHPPPPIPPARSLSEILGSHSTASVINADVMNSLQGGIGCGLAHGFIERGHGLFYAPKARVYFHKRV